MDETSWQLLQLSEEKVFALNKNKKLLAASVNLDNSRLLTALLNAGVLTAEEEHEIQGEKKNERKMSLVLELLKQKGDQHYWAFCQTLDTFQGQHVTAQLHAAELEKHIKKELQNNNGPDSFRHLKGSPLAQVTRTVTLDSNFHLSSHGTRIASLMLNLESCTTWNLVECGLTANDLVVLTGSFVHIGKGHVALQCQELSLESNRLQGAGFTVGKLLLLMPHCISLCLARCRLNKDDLAAFTSIVRHANLQVKRLDLQMNQLAGAGHVLAEILLLMPSCTYLDISYRHLAPNDVMAMANGLHAKTVKKLEKLDLQINKLGGAGPAIGRLLCCLPACTSLNLSCCHLTAEDLHRIADTIGDREFVCPVTSLHLGLNQLENGGGAIGRLLVATSNCTFLDLSDCQLSDIDLKQMADELSMASPKVETLYLGGNDLHGAGSTLGRLLQTMTLATRWLLDRCCLSANDLSALALRLGDARLRQVLKVDISENDINWTPGLLASVNVTAIEWDNGFALFRERLRRRLPVLERQGSSINSRRSTSYESWDDTDAGLTLEETYL